MEDTLSRVMTILGIGSWAVTQGPSQPALAAGGSVRREDTEPRWRHLALTGTGRRWLVGFPRGQRPHEFCRRFPGLANDLAWAWREPAQADALIVHMGGNLRRQAAPSRVLRELAALQALNRDRAQGQPAVGPQSAGAPVVAR